MSLVSLVVYSTDIFIPDQGSKIDSKKIIIVLSDGKILGDDKKLSDVLNMPQMKGVTRYSIGVSVLLTAYFHRILDHILKFFKCTSSVGVTNFSNLF